MQNSPNHGNKSKVLVLMSGGVDSSTAAVLLCEQGYQVAGVYLKLWDSTSSHPERSEGSPTYVGRAFARDSSPTSQNDKLLGDPCWAQEMRDAAQVAAKLGIPFQVWDVTEDYKKRVLQNFYSEYASGRTPNPDILCNSEIKFGVALDRAIALGYDFVATGHYARVHNPPQPSLILREGESSNVPPLKVRGGEGELWTAVDKNKDQSYFLWRLTQEQLAHVLFPIGEYAKTEVRRIAQKFGLHNAQKKDSQGVCFLGKIKLKDFLSSLRDDASSLSDGPIVDVHGRLLGFHDGLAHFTIGQRHGTKLGGTGPYFVVEKDDALNTLIVANEEDEPKYRAVNCEVSGFRCQVDISAGGLRCMARVRYRAPLNEVRVMRHEVRDQARSMLHDSCFMIQFKEPQRAVTPGQSIVFYRDEQIIGGGLIDSVTLKHNPIRNFQCINLQICTL